MSVPNTFSVRPAQFWQHGDENRREVVMTTRYGNSYTKLTRG